MSASQPNILFIMTDQQRIDTLGCYGNAAVQTPHVDSLAADGMRFDNSFCAYPVCTPSRYSLISGMYVHEHRGWSNHCTLPPEIETFPRILKRSGYRTKAIGKMHYTPTYADVGFEDMLLAEQHGPGRWDDDYHRDLRRLGLIDRNDLEDQEEEFRKGAHPEYWKNFGALPSNLPEEHHSTTWIGNHAVRALEEWAPEGNLLVASFVKPHHPHDPPHPWNERYDPRALPLLPGWTEQCLVRDLEMHAGYFPNKDLTEDAMRRIMAHYYANVSHIDHHVGRMIAVLKRKGYYDNTLIVFTSDHGDYLGYHHQVLKGGWMYDPLVKVPLVIKFPSQTGQRGRATSALVNNIDLAPTILRAAGCEPAASMRGLDLASNSKPREFLFAETRWAQHQLMARTQHGKLILNRGNQKHCFYDLKRDPFELQNLYGQAEYSDEIRRYEQALQDWRGDASVSPPYLDEAAPCIERPNVPSRQDDHRAEMLSYARKKMAER